MLILIFILGLGLYFCKNPIFSRLNLLTAYKENVKIMLSLPVFPPFEIMVLLNRRNSYLLSRLVGTMQPYTTTEVRPLVTVVIPTRNRSESVIKAINSVLQVDYPYFKLVVVDQSEDGATRKLVQPLLHDPRFYYLPTRTKGVATGRNIGVAAASSEFIVFTDDDCEVPANWLTEMVAALQLDERIGLVFGNVLSAPYDTSVGFTPTYTCKQDYLARNIKNKNRIRGIGACFGIRRSIWQAVGGFDQHTGPGSFFQSCEDGDYTIKILLNHYFAYQTPRIEVVHYGFRNWKQGRALARRNWFGIGAVLTKYLKCGNWQVLPVFTYELSLVLALILMNLVKHRRIRGITGLLAFLQGMAVALKTPIIRQTYSFSLPDPTLDLPINAELPIWVSSETHSLADS